MTELHLNPDKRASINVDIGGTFTDCFIAYGDKMVFGKAPTTSYNLSKGFMQALRETVTSLGISLEELLEETETIRYSTTMAINRLIERKGPRLGLFTTEGFEDTLPAGRGGRIVLSAVPGRIERDHRRQYRDERGRNECREVRRYST